MSQLDFRRETVSDFFDSLIGSNLADAGTYTAPAGSPVACRLILNRANAMFGDFGHVVGDNLSVRIVSADLAAAAVRGATVAMTSVALGTETFRLVELLADDGALTQWRVERV